MQMLNISHEYLFSLDQFATGITKIRKVSNQDLRFNQAGRRGIWGIRLYLGSKLKLTTTITITND